MSEIVYVPESTSWDNTFYNYANAYAVNSLNLFEKGEIVRSLLVTIPARLCFLAETITCIVLIPLGLIATLITVPYGIVSRNWDPSEEGCNFMGKKLFHFFSGIHGGIFNPTSIYNDTAKLIPKSYLFGILIIITLGLAELPTSSRSRIKYMR